MNKRVHLRSVKMTALYATISPHFTQDLRTPGKLLKLTPQAMTPVQLLGQFSRSLLALFRCLQVSKSATRTTVAFGRSWRRRSWRGCRCARSSGATSWA